MNKPVERGMHNAVDSVQQHLTDYACRLNYAALPPDVIHAAKVRVIDTLGVLIGGFFGEPCRIARNLASKKPNPDGATLIGTRLKTSLDMAAFVNATTARYIEMNDNYHWPGSRHGHPSDALTPILGVAEYAQSSGRDFITGIVLAYEVFLRISDVFPNLDFDNTMFATLSSAVAASKLLSLSPDQLSHSISMAVVPNVVLRQMKVGHKSMFKAAPAGLAGRGGVFAAMLARAGMEGPHLPFEGKAGWCEHVARTHFSLSAMGGEATPYKILDTQIKNRAANGAVISSIIAAEKLAPIRNIEEVKHITVEVYKHAKERVATGEHHWNPGSREDADHSLPYNVAVALMDGTVTHRSFNDTHLWNPELRALMQKIEVVENSEFTKAFERPPVEHRTRITIVSGSGEQLAGETGGDEDDLFAPRSDAQIEEKFRGHTEDILGSKQVDATLDRLWHLEELRSVAEIPPMFVLD